MIIRVQEVVSLLNGLETTSATMETTMLNVVLMAVMSDDVVADGWIVEMMFVVAV